MTIRSLFGSVFGGGSAVQPVILAKAFPTNVVNQRFRNDILPTRTEPGSVLPVAGLPQSDGLGIFPTNLTGSLDDPGQLKVYPYCDGPAGSAFFMNLWGWSMCGSNDPAQCLWRPDLLIQVRCYAGRIPGPDDPSLLGGSTPNDSIFLTTENSCDTIIRTAGSPGYGQIVAPGRNRVAKLIVDVSQCVLFQFDFAQGAGQSHLSMNAHWALI